MLLAIETATDVCSVALLDGGRPVGLAEVLRPRAHAALLAPLIRDVLAQAERSVGDLTAIAVSAGPGSYTGLRIGASTAKGLAYVNGAALVAVPSLEALAFGAQDVLAEDDLLVAAFQSRRDEVYAAAFRRTPDGLALVADTAAVEVGDLAGWLPEHAGTLWIAGEAGAVVADAVGSAARLLDAGRFRPSAAHVGALGAAKLAAGATVDVAAFEPEYLKDFVAKRARPIFERLPK
jgi:tRNA threonylcarbamoyladenosine biosynthesis protein TsaB